MNKHKTLPFVLGRVLTSSLLRSRLRVGEAETGPMFQIR